MEDELREWITVQPSDGFERGIPEKFEDEFWQEEAEIHNMTLEQLKRATSKLYLGITELTKHDSFVKLFEKVKDEDPIVIAYAMWHGSSIASRLSKAFSKDSP